MFGLPFFLARFALLAVDRHGLKFRILLFSLYGFSIFSGSCVPIFF